MKEIALRTNAYFMKGMSLRMRKNSMVFPLSVVGAGIGDAGTLGRHRAQLAGVFRLPDLADGDALELLAAAVPEVDQAARDRKSTRLNSSHSQISYAVFCL